MDQIEDGLLGQEHKIEKLDHTEYDKILKHGENYAGTLKIIIGTAEEDCQINSVDQVFNIIIEKILLQTEENKPKQI